LHNRAFYSEELNRLQRKSLRPVSAMIIDLNGLKETNDQLGHDAGDALLRRLGEVLNGAISVPNHAARIGGDEFAVLMPGADRHAAVATLDTINELVKINNQFYSNAPLSLSVGLATSEPSETMESMVRRADLAMYEHKREHHASRKAVTSAQQANTSAAI
jgi:diguanylate cyclase (GGDEF)-like protein